MIVLKSNKGSGEIEGATLEEFLIEAYGPDNMAVLIEGITEKKNRSINEIKLLVSQRANSQRRSDKVMFERRGLLELLTSIKRSRIVSNRSRSRRYIMGRR